MPARSRAWLVIAIAAGCVALCIVGLAFAFRNEIGGALALLSEPAADVRDKKQYDAEGVAFDYPGNWSSERETTSESGIVIDAITVESPGSCVAIVQRFRSPVPTEPGNYASAYADALNNQQNKSRGLVSAQQESSESFERDLAGKPAKGQRLHVIVRALGEKVPSTLEVLVRTSKTSTLVLLTSCPDEDLPKVKPGFDLIEETLTLAE